MSFESIMGNCKSLLKWIRHDNDLAQSLSAPRKEVVVKCVKMSLPNAASASVNIPKKEHFNLGYSWQESDDFLNTQPTRTVPIIQSNQNQIDSGDDTIGEDEELENELLGMHIRETFV